MTIIAYTALAAAAILDLLIAMRQDAIALKNNHFSNNRFYAWLRESDELTSPKRLLFLTVLIACCTTMAQMSWIVVMILALVLLAQGIDALLSQRHTTIRHRLNISSCRNRYRRLSGLQVQRGRGFAVHGLCCCHAAYDFAARDHVHKLVNRPNRKTGAKWSRRPQWE